MVVVSRHFEQKMLHYEETNFYRNTNSSTKLGPNSPVIFCTMFFFIFLPHFANNEEKPCPEIFDQSSVKYLEQEKT